MHGHADAGKVVLPEHVKTLNCDNDNASDDAIDELRVANVPKVDVDVPTQTSRDGLLVISDASTHASTPFGVSPDERAGGAASSGGACHRRAFCATNAVALNSRALRLFSSFPG